MTQKLSGSENGKSLLGLSLERFATTARADLRFAPLNVFLLVAIFALGLAVHLTLHQFSARAVVLCLGSALVLAICIRVTQVWEAVVILGTADCLLIFLMLRPESEILLVTAVLALLIAPCVQIAYQWERAVVLRFGSFRGLKTSGLFLMVR